MVFFTSLTRLIAVHWLIERSKISAWMMVPHKFNDAASKQKMMMMMRTPESSSSTPEQLSTSRRCMLQTIVKGGLLIKVLESKEAAASDDDDAGGELSSSSSLSPSKPSAQLENLLPATRVKMFIDRAVKLAVALQATATKATATTSSSNADADLAELKGLLLDPSQRSFFLTQKEADTAKTYLEIDTLDEWTKARQKETENQQSFLSETNVNANNPLTRLNEGFEQWGERRQFQRLLRQQLALERRDPFRAAFNAYTNNLVYTDQYVVTASADEKKRLIRQYNQLPDVTSVIRSDLDLRDLYRNQVLTALDDARAELEYQIRTANTNINNTNNWDELVDLLKQAQTSCNKWFDFVPEASVQAALQKVRGEQQLKTTSSDYLTLSSLSSSSSL